MAHELETFGSETAFATVREPAWHTLGTVLPDYVTTSEMLEIANLAGWDVHLVEHITPGIAPERYATPAFDVLRTNPFDGELDRLATVGKRYKVVQNEELFDFGDLLGSGAKWETAGSVKQGRLVFGSLALERETVLDPSGVADRINSYLLLHTSHDGSVAVQASITPVRVVCANTLNFALSAAKQTFKVRHTQTVEGKMAAAREALGLAEVYFDKFDEEAQALFQTEVSKSQIEDIVTAVYPAPDKDAAKAAKTRYDNKLANIAEIMLSPTSDGVENTAWGVLNALTENLDWNRGTRNGKDESKLVAASGFDPIANAERNRIFKTVKASVGL